MPYVKAKEYKKLQEQLKELKILKNIKKESSWTCGVCLNTYYGLNNLCLFRGDAYICDVGQKPYFQKVAMLTIKGLIDNLLKDNIEQLILQYVYNAGYGSPQLSLVADDECNDLRNYCIHKYDDGEFEECWS